MLKGNSDWRWVVKGILQKITNFLEIITKEQDMNSRSGFEGMDQSYFFKDLFGIF